MTRLAVLVSFSGEGGVERMVLNLVEEWAREGPAVDLLTIRCDSDHLQRLPDGVRHIRLRARHALLSVLEVAGYLRRVHPDALLVAKDRAGRAALLARLLSGSRVPIAIRLGTNLSAALAGQNPIKRWSRIWPMRLTYRLAERVIAVSDGVARDVANTTGVALERISVVRNPVVTPALSSLATESVPHHWLTEPRAIPVALSAGRLTRQKGFDVLIEAFARVRQRTPLRLIILGEGRDRPQLEDLARALGVASDVVLPGFRANPYAWLARADLFVLSSRWEGSPNVLTEALALGVPSVATECPSGPIEILAGGRYGPLVPVDDVSALARAMERALVQPLAAATLREAVADYQVEKSAARYLEVLGLCSR